MFGKIKVQEKNKHQQRPNKREQQSNQKIKAPITHKIHKYQPNTPNKPNPHYKQEQQHNTKSKSKNLFLNKNKNVMNRSLKGSEFRLLNQILYTQDSKKAVQYFEQNPQYCNTYHQGFREQTVLWQVNPLDLIIKIILQQRKNLQTKKIIDLGCGQGRLQQSIQHTGCKIRSFDIMQLKPFIIKADISNLKLKCMMIQYSAETQDIAIFCLSLMGINYIQFILEALRVLKVGGELFIAEVESRCKNWKQFQDMMGFLGCKIKQLKRERYFRLMIFEKTQNKKVRKENKYPKSGETLSQRSQTILNPCIYKRR